MKKFIKGFCFFLLGGTQHIGFIGDFCLDIWVSTVFSREFSLSDVLSGYLSLGSIFQRVYFNRQFEEVYKMIWFVIIWYNTAYYCFINDFCLDIYRVSVVCSSEFILIGNLKKFVKGLGFLLFGILQHISLSAIYVRIFVNCRHAIPLSLV